MKANFQMKPFCPDNDIEPAMALLQRLTNDATLTKGDILGYGSWDWSKAVYLDGELGAFMIYDLPPGETIFKVFLLVEDPYFARFQLKKILLTTAKTQLEGLRKAECGVEAIEIMFNERDEETWRLLLNEGFTYHAMKRGAFSDGKHEANGLVFRFTGEA